MAFKLDQVSMGRSAALAVTGVLMAAAAGCSGADFPGSDGGVHNGSPDGSMMADQDAGPMGDAGPLDAGPGDAGPLDAGPGDAGPLDAGPGDAGPLDAGAGDAGPVDAGPSGDAGPALDGGQLDAGERDAGPLVQTPTTVSAIVAAGLNGPRDVLVSSVVVVAVGTPRDTDGSIDFWIQDEGTDAGTGIDVVKTPGETFAVPVVGDVVTVSGYVARKDGLLNIAASVAQNITLDVTIDSSSGTVAGGAYPPAGTPIMESTTTSYDHTTTNAVPHQLGNVLQFAGPLTVTMDRALLLTGVDGGTRPVGFEVTGGMYVYDDLISKNCLDAGVPALTLTNGISGVWGRYQDPNGTGVDGGGVPIYPVLIPVGCGDLNP